MAHTPVRLHQGTIVYYKLKLPNFQAHAFRLLRVGGVFSFCNLTSWGELLKTKYEPSKEGIEKMFIETQIPHLLDAGFKRENISWEIVEVDFDKDCKYYATKYMLAPKCIKA